MENNSCNSNKQFYKSLAIFVLMMGVCVSLVLVLIGPNAKQVHAAKAVAPPMSQNYSSAHK